jgi:glycosyltransferase involved in cell wall biosynthesis
MLDSLTSSRQPREPALLALGLRLARAANRDRAHVLMTLETGGGGSARHVLDLSAGLIARGVCVTLAYSGRRAERWFEQRVRALPGLHAARVDMAREISFRDVSAALAIRRHLTRFGPFDVVHGHSSKGGALARLAAIGLGVPRVYTPHAFVTLNPTLGALKGAVYATAERVLGRVAEAVICVSQEEHAHALALGLPAEKLHLVPNGIGRLPDGNRSEARRKLELEPKHVCIGFVGRLSPQKAVHRLVDAFAEVRRAVPECRLALVGAGPEEPALRALAARHGVADEIAWMGMEDGPSLMAGFDVFALPSLYEGFPYVLLEAAHRKLPIVTTQIGGAANVVQDGVNGFIVREPEPTRYAECLTRLARDSLLRARMSAAAVVAVRAMTAEQMVERTLDVYAAAAKIKQQSREDDRNGRTGRLARARNTFAAATFDAARTERG